ncbi:hypothetical protein MMC25_007089 [Agyrium rufum]|nr:hypothetical protein [Agyrium rufum]
MASTRERSQSAGSLLERSSTIPLADHLQHPSTDLRRDEITLTNQPRSASLGGVLLGQDPPTAGVVSMDFAAAKSPSMSNTADQSETPQTTDNPIRSPSLSSPKDGPSSIKESQSPTSSLAANHMTPRACHEQQFLPLSSTTTKLHSASNDISLDTPRGRIFSITGSQKRSPAPKTRTKFLPLLEIPSSILSNTRGKEPSLSSDSSNDSDLDEYDEYAVFLDSPSGSPEKEASKPEGSSDGPLNIRLHRINPYAKSSTFIQKQKAKPIVDEIDDLSPGDGDKEALAKRNAVLEPVSLTILVRSQTIDEVVEDSEGHARGIVDIYRDTNLDEDDSDTPGLEPDRPIDDADDADDEEEEYIGPDLTTFGGHRDTFALLDLPSPHILRKAYTSTSLSDCAFPESAIAASRRQSRAVPEGVDECDDDYNNEGLDKGLGLLSDYLANEFKAGDDKHAVSTVGEDRVLRVQSGDVLGLRFPKGFWKGVVKCVEAPDSEDEDGDEKGGAGDNPARQHEEFADGAHKEAGTQSQAGQS